MNAEAELEFQAAYPWIKWREPVHVALRDGSAGGYACRLCIAYNGLKGSEIAEKVMSEAECRAHIEREHPRGT